MYQISIQKSNLATARNLKSIKQQVHEILNVKPKANISEPRFQDDFVKAENDNLIETNQLPDSDNCKQNELS